MSQVWCSVKTCWLTTFYCKTRRWIKPSLSWMSIWGIASASHRMLTTPRATSVGRVLTKGQMEDRRSDPSPQSSHLRQPGCSIHSRLSTHRIRWPTWAALSINKWWRRSSSNHEAASLNCKEIQMKMTCKDYQANCSLDLRYREHLKVVNDRNNIKGRTFHSSKRLFNPSSVGRSLRTRPKSMSIRPHLRTKETRYPERRQMSRCVTSSRTCNRQTSHSTETLPLTTNDRSSASSMNTTNLDSNPKFTTKRTSNRFNCNSRRRTRSKAAG